MKRFQALFLYYVALTAYHAKNALVAIAIVAALVALCAICATIVFFGFKLAFMFPGAFLAFQAIVYGTGVPCFIAFVGLFLNEVFLGNKKYTK